MALSEYERRVTEAVLEWLQLRDEGNGPMFGVSRWPSGDDAEKSILLRRLLDDDPVYTVPPPRRFGEPWYELFEQGRVQVTQAIVRHHQLAVTIEGYDWGIHRRTRDGRYYVSYRSDGPRCWLTFDASDSTVAWLELDDPVPTTRERNVYAKTNT